MTKVSIPFSAEKCINIAPTDFNINVNGKSYPLCSVIASRFSRFLLQLFIEDPIACDVDISLPDGDFEPVCQYLNTGKINITPENYLYLLNCSHILQSDDLQQQILNSIKITPEQALSLITEAFDNDMDCEIYANYIGSKLINVFRDYEPKLKNLKPEILEIIFKSNYQNIDPFILKNFLLEKLKSSSDPNFRLIPYFPFAVFKQEEIKQLLTHNFNINLVRSVLVKHTATNCVTVDTSLVYIPIEGKLLDGIIHLYRKPLVKT